MPDKDIETSTVAALEGMRSVAVELSYLISSSTKGEERIDLNNAHRYVMGAIDLLKKVHPWVS